jgi:hypothetical protein
MLGTRSTICDAVGRTGTIEPGRSLVNEGLIDVRVGPRGPLAEGPVTLTADLAGWDSTLPPTSDGLTSRRHVTAAMTIMPRDPDRHLDSLNAAIAAFAADPRLQPWLDAETNTLYDSRSQFGFWTDLTWWAGTWELWITPTNQGTQRALRMRYDPAARTVADVRVVATYLAAADDPDADHTTQAQAPDTTIPAN